MGMKYFFIGDMRSNEGPANVNKGIIANLTADFTYLKAGKTLSKLAEALVKTLACKVVIVSTPSRCGMYMTRLARFLHKKSVFIMHGCVEWEVELNSFSLDKEMRNGIFYERELMKNVDLILPVSRRYSILMQQRYPQHKEKFSFLYNGITVPEMLKTRHEDICRKKGSVIAAGGDRKLKNNIVVARAMKKLDKNGKLVVYGSVYDPAHLPRDERIEFKGQIPQSKFYEEMMASELFVLNSTCESFGLAVFDALLCGCSVLISNAAGALDLLDVTEHDVIYDPNDEDEIAEKIAYLLEHPNNERIMKGLDLEALSYKSEVQKLQAICEKLASS